MKKRAAFFSFLISCLTFIFSSVGLAGPHSSIPQQRHGNIKERLVTLRNWKLMDEFNLTGDRATQVFNILKTFDDKREELIFKRRTLFRNLREELQRSIPAEDRLRKLMKEINVVNVELASLPQEETKALAPVFTVKEQAQYLLFSERFAREARRLLTRKASGPNGPFMNRRPK